ncbi:MAG: bacillithiol biosynthesis cysteine-adding enzyme BshC, partial [Gemmatimonadetes bacterium]|nr:bacillithiol biosynthesis cysteine-adding enzyme BshC [Gemmatimonadota bacterium]NIQ55756.1 bacillithiol biosynthesis cysteine-adding enzyme BshC [Gemmatimonadota bacterium]NIU75967.1 bacillithiol biosynthesis cysteine-adding enzyme BshC [Gammaproteobacteria bacterium]NIX45559.1 bacillithiol biosynthesis cysteine-adding enzyme BshC [Gemmatimonadota bacterium]NIY09844.1 bacillithiol biosynthesis cysteine-adding enzyme BshC [Gemmatimonadota bacterium]
DYIRGDPTLAPFFPGHPFAADAYRRKARDVRERFDADALREMAGAIRPIGDGAAERLDRIARGDGFLVTTGQQPGLFGGPLYTVHKALSAIALARHLEALLEAPVLPLFWVASDDHDWDEANHTYLLDTANELHRLVLRGDPDARHSMGQRPLDGAAGDTLDELAELLPPSDFTPAILKRLRGAYAGPTVAAGFARTLETLLPDAALGFVDAQDPVLRRLGAPVVRRELERTEAHGAALRRQTARLEEAGYQTQVPVLPGASNVFYEDPEQGRERLLREGDAWELRASGRTLADGELWSLFDASPERFSANVVLRPVVESAVFPTLAYVGGPGETRYLAQTGCLFEAHGVGMPVVFPRFSVTLIEGKVRKVLDKFSITEEDLLGRPIHEVVSAVVRDDVPEAVREAVGRLRQSLQEGYQAVYDAAEEIDPTLKGPIFHARNEGFKAISDVEKKIRHHVKLKEETELEQIEKAAVNLAPEGKPQERVLNVHQYLARYGDALIPAILERMEVRLDGDGAGWTGVACD